MDRGVDLHAVTTTGVVATDLLEPDTRISCAVCQREIPLSAAASREASDYVEYYCGLDCYERWRNQSSSLRTTEPR